MVSPKKKEIVGLLVVSLNHVKHDHVELYR